MPAPARPLDLMQFEAEGAGKAQLEQLATAFGLTRGETESVMASVLPEISRNLERQSLSRGGVADILSMLGEAGTKPVDLAKDTGMSRGNALLEQVFGTRDASRAVAARASRASGVGDTVIKAMLPYNHTDGDGRLCAPGERRPGRHPLEDPGHWRRGAQPQR
jgi:hypothetical protein